MAVASFTLCLSPPLSSLRPPRYHRTQTSCCRTTQLALSTTDNTLNQIQNSGVIACLRANTAELALEAARAALNGGISVLEIVTSTPGVFEVIQQLVEEHPSVTLGVGTVLNTEDADSAINAGAKFMMSPAIIKDIMNVAQDGDVLYIPGAMTPTEILTVYDAGARIVKVYPVSALGGIRYISAVKKPFPHIPMVASQGISMDSVEDYILGGASAVVLSDAIFHKDAMSQYNFDAISRLAHTAASNGRNTVRRSYTEGSSRNNFIFSLQKEFYASLSPNIQELIS